ncbi:MAG: tyrosine decarboxylase MfnA, partial [Asgard group archaeon]|nr:tyrosine decarboxylase MfnA [Asgard group archaeon]
MSTKKNESYKKVEKILDDYLITEQSYDRILNSMCTPPPSFTREIASKFAEINLGDPGNFPKTAQIEQELLEYVAQLLHAPSHWAGTVTSGGSESNLLGCWAARKWGKAKKGITHGEIILPSSAHVSFIKALDILSLKAKWIPVTNDQTIDIETVKENISSQTVGIIGIAGNTGAGACDDIAALNDLAIDYNCFLHVDAAFGGFIYPFLERFNRSSPVFDFRLPGVQSITIDEHKLLSSLIPCGTLLFRNGEIFHLIEKPITYLADENCLQATITGTRPGAPVIASWLLLKYLGTDYLENKIEYCLSLTDYTL